MIFLLRSICSLICLPLLITSVCTAQPCKTDAKLINSPNALRASINADGSKKVVSLTRLIPGLVTDFRYATTNNFTKKVLYTHPAAYMRMAPALALKQVQEELNKKGLALKIYDAYRPFSVTCRLWQDIPDKRYVANPRKGSQHNRAIAADLTIIDLKTSKELDMGTGFDNFTDSAHHSFTALPASVLANRRLLKYTMWKHGFNFVPTEWWHYHWRNKDFEVLDISFDDLATIAE